MLKEKTKYPNLNQEENLCLDAWYVGKKSLIIIEEQWYIPHIRPRWEDKTNTEENPHPDWKPRRWIVEVSHSWFNRFRKILVRFEKTLLSYQALLQLAAAIICFRKVGNWYIIYG